MSYSMVRYVMVPVWSGVLCGKSIPNSNDVMRIFSLVVVSQFCAVYVCSNDVPSSSLTFHTPHGPVTART